MKDLQKDSLHYFRIAKQLNEKHHDRLVLNKLHFRGSLNSFSLISVSPEFPEIGVGNLETYKIGEEILEKILENTIVLDAPKRPIPEKEIQAWVIDYSLNNHRKLPYPLADYIFLTSEFAYMTIGNIKGPVCDILALDNNNRLAIIEIKSERVNEVKQQAINFEKKVVERDVCLFHALIGLLGGAGIIWNGEIRKIAIWPAAKGRERKREHLEVDEISYEVIDNPRGYKFKYQYKSPG